MPLTKSSLYIPVHGAKAKLHLMRYKGPGEVVFMVHGAVENGRVFYSDSDKGLGPYLARHGYDVFILDLNGRGCSLPPIGQQTTYGQTESICVEIPEAIDFIHSLRPNCRQHWVGHSWGGVLLSALFARQPERINQVLSQIYFGSKRFIGVRSIRKFFYINVVWFWVCRLLVKKYGYLPARKFRLGADSESYKSHQQCIEWVKGAWIDSDDSFDYTKAMASITLPPTWFIAAKKDYVLGHPLDVQRFMNECGQGTKRYSLLGKQSGNQHDYDHINMLTHPDAIDDHFPQLLKWFESHSEMKAEGLEVTD